MEIISIPQLRLGQLQQLAENSLDITEPITLIQDSRNAAQAAFDEFVAGMKKDSAISDKKTLDKTRDRLVSGFFFAIKAEEYYPDSDAATKERIDSLRKIAEDYGFKITKLPYDEETTTIDNMIAKVEAIDLTGMDHLSRWIAPIKAANEDFKAASSDYFDQRVENAGTESATSTAPKLLGALEDLYTMLFAHAKVSSDNSLIDTYQKLSALVREYR